MSMYHKHTLGDLTGLVLLRSMVATDASRVARIHAPTCNMVNTAGKKAVKITTNLDEIVDNLNDHGYPVKRCKCCKESP